MTVSGRVTFDAFARTTAQFYPVTEAKGADNTAFNVNATGNGVAPTVTEYDVLDRVTRTTLPDASFTTIAYGFGTGIGSTATRFQTTVRDNNVTAGLRSRPPTGISGRPTPTTP